MTTRPLRKIIVGQEPYWFVTAEHYLDLLVRMRTAAAALNPVPDSVVGIKRSGLFPAVFLSHKLQLPMFTDSELKNFPHPKLSTPLVVDTTVWSGKSVRRTQARLARSGAEGARVLAMFIREDPRPLVDGLHYLELTDRIMHFWYDEEAHDDK